MGVESRDGGGNRQLRSKRTVLERGPVWMNGDGKV